MKSKGLPTLKVCHVARKIRHQLLPTIDVSKLARETRQLLPPTLHVGHFTREFGKSFSPALGIAFFTDDSGFELPCPTFFVIFIAFGFPLLGGVGAGKNIAETKGSENIKS